MRDGPCRAMREKLERYAIELEICLGVAFVIRVCKSCFARKPSVPGDAPVFADKMMQRPDPPTKIAGLRAIVKTFSKELRRREMLRFRHWGRAFSEISQKLPDVKGFCKEKPAEAGFSGFCWGPTSQENGTAGTRGREPAVLPRNWTETTALSSGVQPRANVTMKSQRASRIAAIVASTVIAQTPASS